MTETWEEHLTAIAAARTMLCVPGDRPDRFDEAAGAGAGAVVLDLEGAVAPDAKERARAHVTEWLGSGHREGRAVVRINPPGTPWHGADLRAVAAHRIPLMLPGAEDPEAVRRTAAAAGPDCVLLPVVETPAGIERAAEVCAVQGVVRAAFGGAGLAARLGVGHDDPQALAYARSRLVMASAAARIAPPVDGAASDLSSSGVLVEEIQHARRLGFGGKLCVHPEQVRPVDEGFAPSEAELDWAREVSAAGEEVSVVEGRLIDEHVRERARRLLAAERF